MSNNLNTLEQLKAIAAQNKEVAVDMNEEVQHGGGGKKLPAGPTLARLVQVIELGEHPQEFNGKAKDPADEIILGFELYGPGFAHGDGTPYLYRTYSIKISRNEKAKARKIFLKLNYKRQASTFAELLGEPYLLYYKEEDSKRKDAKPGDKVTVWDQDNILPAVDPVSGVPYPVPEATDENLRAFLWQYPLREQWDLLRIEGTWDDGRSKNWIQEKILSAVNFEGSKLQALLGGGNVIPTLAAPALPAAPTGVAGAAIPASPVPATPALPQVPQVPSIPALPAAPAA